MWDLPKNGVELDAPEFLPEGWKCVRLTSANSVGETYIRYYSEKHKCVSSVRKCIELDAEDHGTDPTATLKAYDDKKAKSGNGPPEQFSDFQPEQSGLDSEMLAALPPDAPPGNEAFTKVRLAQDAGGNLRAGFQAIEVGGAKINFQVTKAAALDNLYAAFRISRACYVMIQEGLQKDLVAEFKKECLTKLKAFGDGRNQAKPASRRKKKETNESALPDNISDGATLGVSVDPKIDQVAQATEEPIKDSKKEKKKRRSKEPDADVPKVDDTTKTQPSPQADRKHKRKKHIDEEPEGGAGDVAQSEAGPEADGHKKKRRRDDDRKPDSEKRSAEDADKNSGQIKKHRKRKSSLEPDEGAANAQQPAQSAGGPAPVFSAELEEQLLAALPPDPPEGHIALSRCRHIVDKGKDVCAFQNKFPILGKTLHVQVSVNSCCGSRNAAMRIARVCYVKAETTGAKEEVIQLRSELYTICKQYLSGAVAEAEAPTSAADGPASKRDNPDREPSKKVASEDDDEDDYSNSSSSSSSSSSVAEEPVAAVPASEKPAAISSSPDARLTSQKSTVKVHTPQRLVLPRVGRACAKMLARSGLRCNCHFAMDCPARAQRS
eukprot:TRINITY_DN24103_c0_g1_i1.p1 TRINITY_DN24103_c0_g1~~TRINITY_DN24103_c0_g1_i1.p1  ORF type:complete len:606 (-),score=127.44 TRINITY_DN24103_c0_g1_i1:94-1911(-)